MQGIDEFMSLFLTELEQNKELRHYHRFLNSKKTYSFRRAYYQQRLEYVLEYTKKKGKVLDVGCGYGTTSIMLAYFGHKVVGTTLEYYFSELENRLSYWKKYIKTENIEFRYENLFKAKYDENEFDYIIVQDTLHHLEPINNAILIFNNILKPSGVVIASEENGQNYISRIKRFKERGFNRVIEYYDEKLGEKIMFGNENTRSFRKWNRIFSRNGFSIHTTSIEFIRLLPPIFFRRSDMRSVISIEQKLSKILKPIRRYFFFGINFVARIKNEGNIMQG